MARYKKTKKYSKPTQEALPGRFGSIFSNTKEIKNLLSANMTTCLNSFNWLRHEISFNEPRNLFFRPIKGQQPFFDFSCMRGIESAYDYILTSTKTKISVPQVCNIHYLICNKADVKINDTYIHAGIIRKTNIPLEIETALQNIIQKCDKFDFYTAFDIHYEMIALQPFDDYNKRTARMVMNWMFLQNGFAPIAFTRPSDKTHYQDALLKMKNGDKKAYYRYMTNAMIYSQEQIIKQLQQSQIR